MNEQMVNLKKLLAIILQKIHDLMNGKINSIGYDANAHAITQTIGNTSSNVILTTDLAADSAFEVSWNDIQNKPSTFPSAIQIDDELNGTSTNPVQNKVIKTALDAKLSNAVTKIQTGAGLTASTVTSTGTIGHPIVENLAGSYGSTNNTSLTLDWGGSFNNPGIVLNNSGHTTAAFNKTLTLPGSQFAAATTSNGIKGLVPAPSTATADPAGMFQTNVSQYFLNANGGWATIPNFTSATSSIVGYPGLVPVTSTATTATYLNDTNKSRYWLNANGSWELFPSYLKVSYNNNTGESSISAGTLYNLAHIDNAISVKSNERRYFRIEGQCAVQSPARDRLLALAIQPYEGTEGQQGYNELDAYFTYSRSVADTSTSGYELLSCSYLLCVDEVKDINIKLQFYGSGSSTESYKLLYKSMLLTIQELPYISRND